MALGTFRRACFAAALAGAFVVGRAAPASADEARPEAIHLRFTVDEGLKGQCPDRARFVELLLKERPRLSLAPEDARARTFEVRIQRAPKSQLAGEVVVVDLEGNTSTRGVSARDCRTLVRALAVVAAVASDVVPEPVEPVIEPPPITNPSPAPPSPIPNARPTPMPPARSPSPKTMLNAGAGTELVLGALPRASMGYRGYIEAQRSLGAFDGILRASFAFARAQLSGTSRLNVFVQTYTARFEGCASTWVAAPISIEACLGLTTGAFHSYSEDALAARDDVRPWLTIGSGLRMRWHLAGGFHSELFANASYVSTVYATVVRPVEIDESAATHRVPRGIGEIGIGIGHSFDLQ